MPDDVRAVCRQVCAVMAANSQSKRAPHKRGPGRPFKPGQSGTPNGSPAAAAAVREATQAWVMGGEVLEKWKAAYLRGLEEGEVSIVLDVAHRLMGKPAAAPEDRDALKSAGMPTRAEVVAALKALASE